MKFKNNIPETKAIVHYHLEEEYKTLFKWYLKEEFDTQQKHIDLWGGLDKLVHGTADYHFKAKSMKAGVCAENPSLHSEASESYKFVQVDLFPKRTQFRVVGSSRIINDFKLYLRCSTYVDKEQDGLGYAPSDSEYNREHFIYINMYLDEITFNDIFNGVKNKQISSMELRVDLPSGFFSEWSPPSLSEVFYATILPQSVKIQNESEVGHEIPRIGKALKMQLDCSYVHQLSNTEEYDVDTDIFYEPVEEVVQVTKDDEIEEVTPEIKEKVDELLSSGSKKNNSFLVLFYTILIVGVSLLAISANT